MLSSYFIVFWLLLYVDKKNMYEGKEGGCLNLFELDESGSVSTPVGR